MISVDTQSLSDYKKKLRKLQRGVPYAMMKVLNDSAFGTREWALNNIAMKMIVRNPNFARHIIRVTKATKNLLVSSTGSIKKDRFSGFLEQELGKPSKILSKRAITKEARGGTFTKQITPSARLKTSKTFDRVNSFVDLRKRSRDGNNQPFIVTKHWTDKWGIHSSRYGVPSLTPGLYKLKGRKNYQKIIAMQIFDRGTVARRKEWMKDAHKKYYSKHPLPQLWKEHLSRAIRDSKK